MWISMSREPLSGAGHVDRASVMEPIYRRDLEREMRGSSACTWENMQAIPVQM